MTDIFRYLYHSIYVNREKTSKVLLNNLKAKWLVICGTVQTNLNKLKNIDDKVITFLDLI